MPLADEASGIFLLKSNIITFKLAQLICYTGKRNNGVRNDAFGGYTYVFKR